MSSLSKAVKGIAKSLSKRFNAEAVGAQAGIEFLNRGGFLEPRFDAIEKFTQESFVNQDPGYLKTVLPWLETKKDGDLFERNDAYLGTWLYYKGLCNFLDKKRIARLAEINEKLVLENIQRRLRGEDTVLLFTLDDIKGLSVDMELEAFKLRLEDILGIESRTMLGLSFESPDDNKTLVLNKNVIMAQSPQMREVYKLLREAMGTDDYSEEAYKKE